MADVPQNQDEKKVPQTAPQNGVNPPLQPPAATPPKGAESNVVFSGNPQSPIPSQTAPVGDIPEEYLTDEDLYPVAQENPSLSATAKKKGPLIAIAIGGIIVVLLLVIALGNILTKKNPSTEKITLTYWGLWETQQVMDEIIKPYQINHPNVTITYTMMDAKDNYLQRLVERTKKGTGPDIFRFHNSWVPQIKQILSVAPQTVLTPDEYQKTYYPVIVKDLNVGGSIVGVPLGIDGIVLLYNDKILKAAGYSNPPQDWETLLNMVQPGKGITVVDQEGKIATSGIALGAAENVNHFSDIVALMFLQNGVSMKSFVGNQNAQSVLTTYTDAVVSPNKFWTEQMDASLIAFAHEQVAMIFAPSWEIEVIRHMNPDLQLGVARVPQIKGGQQKSLASYWAEGVSRTSAHQQAAWEFLKYLSEKDTLTKFYAAAVKSGRLFGYPYPRVDMAPLLLQDQYAGPIIADAPIMDSLPLCSSTYDNGLNDKLISYLKDTVNGVLNGSSVDNSLVTMDKGFTQVYQDYQITY
ncbi:MAG: extracellular solute-binding protein [Patescibacteria group bacterium]|jgi:multiple sugar transport system substrate-binding protein